SRELLEFYRGKVVQFDGEHEDLLEKYRCTTEDQKLQWEREGTLRLYSENNILKIREQEDSKRIQHLLALVGPDIGKVTIAQKKLEPRILDHRKTTKSRTGSEGNHKSRSEEVVNGGSSEQYRGANQTLVLQVLPAQMEEQTGLSKKKVESLLEDRRIHVEEGQVQHQRDQDPITDKYVCSLSTILYHMPLLPHIPHTLPPHTLGAARQEVQLQREDRSDKMAKRLQMMTQRYEALKKRAAMEVEGFKSDIKHLQQKLKDVEKQLFKVSMGQMLYACVRQTNVRTRKVQGELKAKLYRLEKDLHYS
uniref:Uncharacterized protein n=1 Tax=Oncorhynchus mykiss TaxID=8022 RepID=A0A8C7TJ27_ONCMY